MPTRSKTAAAPAPPTPGGKTFQRRIRFGMGAGYTSLSVGPDGSLNRRAFHGNRGDVIVLDPMECCRLDCLGALCPEGWTMADLDAEDARRLAAYRAARGAVPEVTF